MGRNTKSRLEKTEKKIPFEPAFCKCPKNRRLRNVYADVCYSTPRGCTLKTILYRVKGGRIGTY